MINLHPKFIQLCEEAEKANLRVGLWTQGPFNRRQLSSISLEYPKLVGGFPKLAELHAVWGDIELASAGLLEVLNDAQS